METLLTPNDDISKGKLDIQRSWIKNAFWDVINMKSWKWCKLFLPFLLNNTYGLPVITMNTKSPNQVLYFSLVDLQTICAK
jgi:hypothetical protein